MAAEVARAQFSRPRAENEVIAWLRERGLRLAGVYNIACDGEGRAVEADFLFGR
jgi:hypothetical protein